MDTPRKIRKPRNFADLAIELKPRTDHPDWWSRAAVMSSFLSSVVLAGVGLAVTSSIQKAQIQSSKALGDAQVQIAKLKNEDDKRLQENKFASDMLQNLLSDEPRHRKFAIVMLRRTVDASLYEELLSGIASSDPATDVRQAAIRQLGDSRNPNIAVALNKIATDPSRPKEERVLADGAKSNVAVIGTLSEGTCSFFAASSGTHAYESPSSGGIFTSALLEGLKDQTATGGTLGDLANYLQTKVPARALIDVGRSQQPVSNCEGYDVQKAVLFGRPTVALAIGISKYQDPNIPPLMAPGTDAAQVAALLKSRGANVMQLSGDQASRNGILSAASSFSAQCGDGMDCIVYFSGHGFSLSDKGYLVAYDSKLSGDALQTMETCVSTQQLMQMLRQHVGKGSRLILFFDMDTSGAEGLSK